jgi:hypothetical protein
VTNSGARMKKTAARVAITEVKYFFISFAGTLVVGACQSGPYRVTPSAPGTCPSLQVDYPQVPTAAATIMGSGSNGNSVHLWRAVDRSGSEHVLNVDFIPQGGWSVPSETKGLSFSQSTHMPDVFGFDPWEGRQVIYVLEYTLPVAQCDMSVAWDTHLTMALPHGVCATREGTPGTCSSGVQGTAILDMFSIDDPSGIMSVSGSGRTALENAIESHLQTVEPRRRIEVHSNTQSNLRKGSDFTGNFNVSQGVRAHVYFAVAVSLQKTTNGWVCLNLCTSGPNDRLTDFGFLFVEGGRGIGIGVAMSRRTP